MDLKDYLQNRALEIGFHAIRFARPQKLRNHTKILKDWLDKGFCAGMDYMKNYIDLREDPRSAGMLEGAQTIVCLALSYHSSETNSAISPYIARYALCRDYHTVMRKMLKTLLKDLQQIRPQSRGRVCVDSAPVFERAWAELSGLGWIGRNSCLINPEFGSFFVLGEILTTEEIEPDSPIENQCGNCQMCIDHCPTGALILPDGRWLDARRCLSYWTIEDPQNIPQELTHHPVLFGCDACQNSCPWNHDPEVTESPLAPLDRWTKIDIEAFAKLEVEAIEALTRGTPLKRAGARALQHRAKFLYSNSSDVDRR